MVELQRILVVMLCMLVGLVAFTTFQTLGRDARCAADGPVMPSTPVDPYGIFMPDSPSRGR